MRLRPCRPALGARERMNSTQPQPRKLTIDAAPLLFWPLLIVRTIALALCSFVSSIYCTYIVHMNGTKGTNTKLYFRFIQVILYNVDWTGAYKHITVCLFKSCHSFPFWYQQSDLVPMVYCLHCLYWHWSIHFVSTVLYCTVLYCTVLYWHWSIHPCQDNCHPAPASDIIRVVCGTPRPGMAILVEESGLEYCHYRRRKQQYNSDYWLICLAYAYVLCLPQIKFVIYSCDDKVCNV